MPTIPNLLDASLLTGAELAPIVQGGDTKKASIQALADYVAEVVAQPAAELAAPIAAEIVAAGLNAAVDAAETAQGIATAQATIATTKAGEAAGSAAAAAGYAAINGPLRTDLASADPAKGSSLVAFQQSGTGAVGRTVQDRLREVISVRDFGAIGDGNSHPLSERFATLGAAQAVYPHAVALTEEIDRIAVEAALAYVAGAIIGTDQPLALYAGIGGYMMDKTCYVPEGVDFYGVWHIETTARSSTLFIQMEGCGDVFRVVPHIDVANGRRFWFGKIRGMAFRGDATNDPGFALAFRDDAGNGVAPQDTTVIEDISTRELPSGGIEFPDGGLPLSCWRHKHLNNGGPGITVVGGTNAHQALHFLDISGDGNIGGLLHLERLDNRGSVLISNLKSEARTNTAYGGVDGQMSPIVIKNCAAGSVVTINGATHISSIVDGANNKKPGDLVTIIGGNLPHLDWTGVQLRVRPTDTGSDPRIVYSSTLGVAIPYAVKSGRLSDGNRIDRCVTNTARRVFGTVDAYQGASAENVADQVAGTTPGRSLHETDTSATYAQILSAGNFTERINGTSFRQVVTASGIAVRDEHLTPVRFQRFTIATLPAANTQADVFVMVTNPAASKGRLVYSDGSAWRYVSDDSAV